MPSSFSSFLPLKGKTILVTRASGQSTEFSDRLRKLGAKVMEVPALEIIPPSSWGTLDTAISNLCSFNWLILTSANGVEYFFNRLKQRGNSTDDLLAVKIAVVGEKTALSLQAYGLKADFIPPNFVADSLMSNFPEPLQGKKILFPRVESGGREVIVKELTGQGASVTEVPVYQSACPASIPEDVKFFLATEPVDIITFASSKTVKFFCQLTGDMFIKNSRVCIASIGPQTSKTCYSLLGHVDVEAEEYTLEGLTTALIKWVASSP